MEADSARRSLHGPVYGCGDLDLGLSSDSLEDCDTDSLCEERRYQSELQNRIQSNHGVIKEGDCDTEEVHVTAGDTEDQSPQGKGPKPNNRPQDIRTSYSELRYDPDWRKHQNLLHTSDLDEEESLDVTSSDSEQRSPDETTPDPAEDRRSADGHPFWRPLTNVSSKKISATRKPEESGRTRRPGAPRDTADKKKVTAQEASKQDIIEKNKVTLGVRKPKPHSYLHLHKKKIDESQCGQSDGRSDVQPVGDATHPSKEAKLPEAIKESGSAGSPIREKTPKTLNLAGTSSDANALQWDKMADFSGEYGYEYMTIASYPDRYRDFLKSLVGPYSSQEHLQIHNEESYYQNIGPPDMRHGRHIVETMGGAQDPMEKYKCPRLSLIGAQTQPEPPGITYNNVFIPSQMTPPTYAPTAKSTKSNSELESGATNKSSNERTRTCPSGVRRMEEKHQKRLKSFLNQEVKLGGLGPTHAISAEKKEQLKQQKEYAKVTHERNRSKPVKAREIQVTPNDKNKSTRQKSLEYSKNVPRPLPLPKVSNEEKADVPQKRAMSSDPLFPQMKLLEDLQVRHQKEKMAVAALNALHIL